MKQVIFRVIIAAATFLIGIGAVLVWLNRDSSMPTVPPVSVNNIEIARPIFPDDRIYLISFCELVRDPSRYDHKIIRTQAFLE
ncbi:MAG: hypothetical protein M3362_18955, partial [Acidobacteriota bacterium]|nr:hypothetical protein [Acidobacteriota bacterium]